MATYKIRDKETGEIFTVRDKETTQEPAQQAQPQQNILQQLLGATENTIGGIVGGVIEPPTKIVGRAGQAIESMISGKPPQNYSIPLPQYMGGNIDIAPAENLGQAYMPVAGTTLSMLGIKGLMNPKSITGVIKYDNVLTQAKKSKVALDAVRDNLGQAKNIALQEVKDLPAELNWAGNVSQKVINAVKNPVYQVEFTKEGGVVNRIGNLDKVKTALQDLVTTKDFVEAGNMEKRQIMHFAGKVRDTIVQAANDAGKPQLAQALKNYHNFMDKYEVINSKLVDKFGNALGNKLKSVFRWTAEPAVKEAWKEVGKASPEIKGIIKSRETRELLKWLLKIGAPTAIGGGAVIGGVKKFID